MADLAPRITNIVCIAYFLGEPISNPNIHVAKFEITCVTNDVQNYKEPHLLDHALLPRMRLLFFAIDN